MTGCHMPVLFECLPKIVEVEYLEICTFWLGPKSYGKLFDHCQWFTLLKYGILSQSTN